MAKHAARDYVIYRWPILLNICSILTLLVIVCFGGNLTVHLDIVNNTLFVSEMLAGFMVANACLMCWCTCNKDRQSATQTGSIKTKTARWKITRCFKSVGFMLLAIFAFHLIAVVFGAPVIESMTETFHFALLLAAASVLPCVCAIGPSVDLWLKVWTSYSSSHESPHEYNSLLVGLCSVIGAWIGAFPIPLDWDRAWQIWPVSCLIGTLLGHCCGLAAATAYLLSDNRRKNRPKFV